VTCAIAAAALLHMLPRITCCGCSCESSAHVACVSVPVACSYTCGMQPGGYHYNTTTTNTAQSGYWLALPNTNTAHGLCSPQSASCAIRGRKLYVIPRTCGLLGVSHAIRASSWSPSPLSTCTFLYPHLVQLKKRNLTAAGIFFVATCDMRCPPQGTGAVEPLAPLKAPRRAGGESGATSPSHTFVPGACCSLASSVVALASAQCVGQEVQLF
jgi:hypothetical protein